MGTFIDITTAALVSILILIHSKSTSGESPSVQKERSWLNFSPWELHSLNEIIIELGLLSCPAMDKPSARSLKGFVSEAVKKAERREVMNPSFLQVYNNMVQCKDHLHDQAKNPGKVMKSAAAYISDDQVKYSAESQAVQKEQNEKGWVANAMVPNAESKEEMEIKEKSGEQICLDEPQSHTTVESASLESDNDASDSQDEEGIVQQIVSWLTDYKFGQLFTTYDRSKRNAEESAKENVVTNTAKDAALNDGSQNLQAMYMILTSILTKTCPKELRPDTPFSLHLIREFVYYVSEDEYQLTVASKKYFEKDLLIKQAQKCLASLNR